MDLEHLCPNCGRPMIYHANLDSFFCNECNEYYYATEFNEKKENQFTGVFKELYCKMCGKTTIVDAAFNMDICPFCYNNLLDITDGVYDFNPKFVIHFKDTMDVLQKNIIELAKAEGVPSEIITVINPNSLKGVFIPFYQYSIANNAVCFLQTRESGGKFDADDYFFQKFELSDESDVLIDTTRVLSNRVISEMADYNFKQVDMLFPKHLTGYYTLKPSYGGDAAWAELKKVVNEYSKNETLKYKEKSEAVKELKVFNEIRTLSRKMILLPVWIFEFIYNDEVHYLYVNGQTGRMTSDVEYEHKVKSGGLFSKKKTINYQINVKAANLSRRDEYKTSLDYMNQLKKYEVNKNDRLSGIRKTR